MSFPKSVVKRLDHFMSIINIKSMKQSAPANPLYTQDPLALTDNNVKLKLIKAAVKSVLENLCIKDTAGVDGTPVNKLLSCMDLFVQISKGAKPIESLITLSEFINDLSKGDLKIGLAQTNCVNDASGFIDSLISKSTKKTQEKAKEESDDEESDSESDSESESESEEEETKEKKNKEEKSNKEQKSQVEEKKEFNSKDAKKLENNSTEKKSDPKKEESKSKFKSSRNSDKNSKTKNVPDINNRLGDFKLVKSAPNRVQMSSDDVDDLLDDELGSALEAQEKLVPSASYRKKYKKQKLSSVPSFDHPRFMTEKEIKDLETKYPSMKASRRLALNENPLGKFVNINKN